MRGRFKDNGTVPLSLLDDFWGEWQQIKKDLADGVISKAEYLEWKLNWPQTAGPRPSKQWRKPPDTTP